jgi:hypothetical protein
MRRIAWLSPNIPSDLAGPFFMASSSINGVLDKRFWVPELEHCNPGYSGCKNPSLDSAFLRNAAINLEHGRKQIALLSSEHLPSVLEPVREYLLENLRFFREIELARYRYLRNNDAHALRETLCKYCGCTSTEPEVLTELATTKDGEAKIRLTRYQWYNDVLRCHDDARSHKYPVAAWQAFLKEFGITEIAKQMDVD